MPYSTVSRNGTLLGALFESLATLCAPTAGVVAIEVKLARTVDDSDTKHLSWLEQRLGDGLLDRLIITTGPTAYRRQDGVAVVPLALLGP